MKKFLNEAILVRTYTLRSPNPLKKGALDFPPFKRGARGDQGFRLQCVSPISHNISIDLLYKYFLSHAKMSQCVGETLRCAGSQGTLLGGQCPT
jgi:hypothetical protein